ncbi:uncharacterized protein SPAPADRAFT_140581 [Spathaspora passalidarum NRRL Y-27907]|uniref:Uncharacterized protein n=1 Tax=Spathaspora passalidarum (strain NRRL Y-27907 / 11-Y1) TaxID=619300 RepID=G3ARZ0_SPAPN|nr:uncharacterized protein SPAPADRAFT_140581 [Spathaspora passalidarum NRRL Y-27907]EGW31839.1 hypothetical protein SPAPADRAFT_140581 [Spathaspora passalidarum NRRL Y-27907]
MLYKVFRIILIFLSLAVTLLSIFAVIGSYANKPYLTDAYIIKFQLTNFNLKQVINVNQFAKREDWTATTTPSGQWVYPTPMPTPTPVPGVTTPNGYYTSVPAAIGDLLTRLTPAELGIADIYSIGFWGYCRGALVAPPARYSSNGALIQQNPIVNFTWCSDPRPGFFFDPVKVLKQEMNRALDGQIVDSESAVLTQLSTESKSEIKVLIDNISLDYFNLPGDLTADLGHFEKLTQAAFGLIVSVIVFAFVETILLILGYFFSPNKCILSFLNFLFELIIAVLLFSGTTILTGIYMRVRKVTNAYIDTFGIKATLSINMYAFLWSGVVAAVLLVLFNFLGHCVGLFGSGRRHYRSVGNPEAAYEHNEEPKEEAKEETKEEKKESKEETDSDSD